jgi:hypothetical protein
LSQRKPLLLATCDLSVNEKSYQSWAKECFTSVRTDLSSDSLKKLKAIAKTEILRQQVQTLFIQSTYRKDFGAELPRCHDEDDRLLSSQRSAQVLQSILCQQMPNCRSFYIRGPTNEANDRINVTTTEVTTWILSVVAERA